MSGEDDPQARVAAFPPDVRALTPPPRRSAGTGGLRWLRYLLLIAVVFGFTQSFVMLRQFLGADSPWLGLQLMLYFLGLTKVAEPIFTLRMPGRLRSIQPEERDGALYRKLLVPQFGQMLRDTPLRYLNLAVYVKKGRPDLRTLVRYVEAAEAAHFWAAVLFAPYIAYVFLKGRPWVAGFFFLVQVFFNVYPIFHLRIVRERLDRHFGKKSGHGLQENFSSGSVSKLRA
ncbi:MAG: hypothetical protein ABJC13_02150 [Acidobacteriota bacterium]